MRAGGAAVLSVAPRVGRLVSQRRRSCEGKNGDEYS
jgi:hypothetical protein